MRYLVLGAAVIAAAAIWVGYDRNQKAERGVEQELLTYPADEPLRGHRQHLTFDPDEKTELLGPEAGMVRNLKGLCTQSNPDPDCPTPRSLSERAAE